MENIQQTILGAFSHKTAWHLTFVFRLYFANNANIYLLIVCFNKIHRQPIRFVFLQTNEKRDNIDFHLEEMLTTNQ